MQTVKKSAPNIIIVINNMKWEHFGCFVSKLSLREIFFKASQKKYSIKCFHLHYNVGNFSGVLSLVTV